MRVCLASSGGPPFGYSSPQGQSPRLHMEVDTTVVTVGDRITLTVSVDHAPGSPGHLARLAGSDSLRDPGRPNPPPGTPRGE